MPKKAISVTLDETNLVWLQGLAARGQARSLSEALDRLVRDARTSGTHAAAAARSVVGSIDISQSDPGLEDADAAIRGLFDRSLKRPFIVREDSPRWPRRRRQRG